MAKIFEGSQNTDKSNAQHAGEVWEDLEVEGPLVFMRDYAGAQHFSLRTLDLKVCERL